MSIDDEIDMVHMWEALADKAAERARRAKRRQVLYRQQAQYHRDRATDAMTEALGTKDDGDPPWPFVLSPKDEAFIEKLTACFAPADQPARKVNESDVYVDEQGNRWDLLDHPRDPRAWQNAETGEVRPGPTWSWSKS